MIDKINSELPSGGNRFNKQYLRQQEECKQLTFDDEVQIIKTGTKSINLTQRNWGVRLKPLGDEQMRN